MLTWIQSNRDSNSLLMDMQNGYSYLGRLAVSYKAKHKSYKAKHANPLIHP